MKNKVISISVALCFSFLLVSFFPSFNPEKDIIEEGKCLNNIYLDKTTPNEIISVYGAGIIKNYKKRFEKKRGYSNIRWIELDYEKLGLQFKAGSEKMSIYDIIVSIPCGAKTKKGIELGVSQISDVIESYGQPNERGNVLKKSYFGKDSIYAACCDSIYYYPALGIDFTFNCDTSFIQNNSAIDRKQKALSCFKVIRIHIYTPHLTQNK